MKKILFFLLNFISLTLPAQDGISGWVDTDSVDTFIGVYNSPSNLRSDIFNHYAEYISLGDLRTGKFKLTIYDAVVHGETFFTNISARHALYDIYIDKVVYLDGSTYSIIRHEKPTTLNRRGKK